MFYRNWSYRLPAHQRLRDISHSESSLFSLGPTGLEKVVELFASTKLSLMASTAFISSQPTSGPSSSCEMIILRNNSHYGIIRVRMGIFTTTLRNKKNTSNSQKNSSPYFHSVLLVIWPLTLMKRTHFSEMSISKFSTYPRKAQGWTFHFRTPDLRSEKFQRKIPLAGDPTVTWHEEIVLAPQVPSYSRVPGEAQSKKEARLPGWFSTVLCQGWCGRGRLSSRVPVHKETKH